MSTLRMPSPSRVLPVPLSTKARTRKFKAPRTSSALLPRPVCTTSVNRSDLSRTISDGKSRAARTVEAVPAIAESKISPRKNGLSATNTLL